MVCLGYRLAAVGSEQPQIFFNLPYINFKARDFHIMTCPIDHALWYKREK